MLKIKEENPNLRGLGWLTETTKPSKEIWQAIGGSKARRHPPNIWYDILTNVQEYIDMPRKAELSEEVEELHNKINKLASTLEVLGRKLSSCQEGIHDLKEELDERPIVKGTKLFDIGEDFTVLQPIPIVIEESENEVIASFPEVEVFAVGVVEAEAISNLKRLIGELYSDLDNTPSEELGRTAQGWKRMLGKVVKRIGAT